MCQRSHKGAEEEDQACQDQIQGQNGEEVHQWRCEGCLEESEHHDWQNSGRLSSGGRAVVL